LKIPQCNRSSQIILRVSVSILVFQASFERKWSFPISRVYKKPPEFAIGTMKSFYEKFSCILEQKEKKSREKLPERYQTILNQSNTPPSLWALGPKRKT